MSVYDIIAILGALIIAGAFIYFVYSAVEVAIGKDKP